MKKSNAKRVADIHRISRTVSKDPRSNAWGHVFTLLTPLADTGSARLDEGRLYVRVSEGAEEVLAHTFTPDQEVSAHAGLAYWNLL